MNGHPRDQAKLSVHCRWPLIRGNLTLKCVGRGFDNVAVQGRWPLTTGGRPRQVLLYSIGVIIIFIPERTTSLDTSSRTLFVCVFVGMSMSRRTSSYVSHQIVIERRVT